MKRIISVFSCLIILSGFYLRLAAQGLLSGSAETQTIFYFDDKQTRAVPPDQGIGSNNYFKMDYTHQKLKAGIRYEAYLPVLQGLPGELHGNKLAFKYASFEDSSLHITAGDFYDQFGNGLIFRAYEERTLGLNTSVEGIRLAYSPGRVLRLRAFAGRPREFMDNSSTVVKGASVEADLAPLLHFTSTTLTTEVSFINRYLSYAGQADIPAHVNAYAFRANWGRRNFSVNGEYAYKTKDPAAYNNFIPKDGSALLVGISYASPGLGSTLTLRRLEHMQLGSSRGITGIGRELNFLPALTRQYEYALPGLLPHRAVGEQETGGQFDFRYRIKKGSLLGGKYGTKLAFNASAYYNLKGNAEQGYAFFARGRTRYFRDISADLEKKTGEKTTIHFLYAAQVYNPLLTGKENAQYVSQAAVADVTRKIGATRSARITLQHLWSRDYQKNWAAIQAEFTPSDALAFFAGDMYNYGSAGTHYYNAGGSYSFSRSRVSLSYARNREGLVCVGGICQLLPAYTGFNLSVTSSF